MTASSGPQPGPQPGPGHPAVPADPGSPVPPSASTPSNTVTTTGAPQETSKDAAPTTPPPAEDEDNDTAAAYESRHVHTVYEAIAPHFSSTRYKPWPLVASFLLSLPPGSVGLDAGCGNGKYIGVNPDLFIVASDRSANLVSLARRYQPPHFDAAAGPKKKNKGGNKKVAADSEAPATPAPKNQVLVADSLALPYRTSAFDFAISIAVIHHMSTRERRRAAVAALLSAVRPGTAAEQGGKALVMVWALEQGNSRRGWDAGAAQDQLVSWVTKGKKEKPEGRGQEKEQDKERAAAEPAKDETFQRYYHLYREGELEEDVVEVGGRVLESGYERDNWWAIFCRDS
ncbi:tRNA (Uracil-5-)-methyltransferase TRM9 [Colletotrichum lupini]|uniref:tRNA (Uracil-5-)-methyltransferase TRM9 n=1 Tax=Colletotrichum lupini TaxID=145971 RepID=A0A9Q8SBR8_9PEZI|nr:tRNA (Uracil-5-)-methyltransferase TRM9 [Colletotrichum lupini]UQC74158.1 tRNA (Uracil-5-)-methyltransferase TRM9 [Colletotrichum lupini]